MTNRRDFLAAACGLTAGIAVTGSGPLLRSAAAAEDSDKLRFAVIGVNGRGKAHIDGLLKDGGVVITHIVDVDTKVGQRVSDLVEERQGKRPEFVVDFRDVLDRDILDGVCIATPNHLHALQACEALDAGLHVYVEKPVSHNVWEGRQLVRAAEKSSGLCQSGTQSRSYQSLIDAREYLAAGELGDILYAVGTCYKARMPIGQLEKPLDIPEEIDYEKWSGPAEKQDLYRPKVHYDWHWDFNTGNGDMGNQGIHQMDIARWMLGESKVSPLVHSIGGRLGYEDAGNTPNTQTVLHGYDSPLIFETRGLPKSIDQRPKWSNGPDMDDYYGARMGVVVHCENGRLVVPGHSPKAIAYDADGSELKSWDDPGDTTAKHIANFLNAVRADDRSMLNAPAVEGHISSALCHTGGVSHLLGRKATGEECRAAAAREGEVWLDSYNRMAEHLNRNDVDLSEKVLTLGARLEMDPDTELFVGEMADAANDNVLRKRKYRDEFAVKDYS